MLNAIRQIWNTGRRSVIEVAGEQDLKHLADIHKASFSRGWSDGEFEALLAQDSYRCLVARKSGKSVATPAGFVLIKQILDEAEIITIAVKPSARKKGVAARLMGEAIRRMETDRVNALFLEVDEANHSAVALYKRLGFTVMDKRDGYYVKDEAVDSKASAALVMRLDLG